MKRLILVIGLLISTVFCFGEELSSFSGLKFGSTIDEFYNFCEEKKWEVKSIDELNRECVLNYNKSMEWYNNLPKKKKLEKKEPVLKVISKEIILNGEDAITGAVSYAGNEWKASFYFSTNGFSSVKLTRVYKTNSNDSYKKELNYFLNLNSSIANKYKLTVIRNNEYDKEYAKLNKDRFYFSGYSKHPNIDIETSIDGGVDMFNRSQIIVYEHIDFNCFFNEVTKLMDKQAKDISKSIEFYNSL